MERPVQAPRQQLPPGFRFHPTDEELVVQYLRRKALSRPLPAAVIPVVHDAGSLDPWDLPGASDGEAYFFCRRRAPGVGGGRRRAGSGYWKPTGKPKPVFVQGPAGERHLVGVKTALAFHQGKPSAPARTGCWAMHEFRLVVPGGVVRQGKMNASHDRVLQTGEWVVCRVFLKNRARARGRPPSRDAVGGTPAAAGHRVGQAPSPSSSSCVTGVADVADQDEVSSVIRDDAAAFQTGQA